MKSFSVIEVMDKTGAIRLPENLMSLYGVEKGDSLELCLKDRSVVMKKHPPTCIFCGSEKELKEYKEKSFCRCCADDLKNYK